MSKRRIWIGGASALMLGSIAGVASAQYQTNFSTSNINATPGNAQNDFYVGAQMGQLPDNDPAVTPTFNSSGVNLVGATSGSNGTSLTLIDSGPSSNGVYGNTDAVMDFSIIGASNYEFGMAVRGTTKTTGPNTVNNYPIYYVLYDQQTTPGTLGTFSLVSQIGYEDMTTLASQSDLQLTGGSDTYQLELSAQGTGATETLTATLSQNGLVFDTLTAADPMSLNGGTDITQGLVTLMGGSDGNGNYGNTHGIQATSFTVNESTTVPEPASIGLLAIGSIGLLARRRAR